MFTNIGWGQTTSASLRKGRRQVKYSLMKYECTNSLISQNEQGCNESVQAFFGQGKPKLHFQSGKTWALFRIKEEYFTSISSENKYLLLLSTILQFKTWKRIQLFFSKGELLSIKHFDEKSCQVGRLTSSSICFRFRIIEPLRHTYRICRNWNLMLLTLCKKKPTLYTFGIRKFPERWKYLFQWGGGDSVQLYK